MTRPWSSWLFRWHLAPSRLNRYERRRQDRRVRLRNEHLETRLAPAIVYGAPIGTAVVFPGGVNVAVEDVSGDGISDIVTGQSTKGSIVRVINGATGTEYLGFSAYDSQFDGGVYVAAGDLNGDHFADIITGAGAGGGPHVKVFDGRTGALLREFFAYDASFSGGVRVAAGDVDGDGKADIITSAGPGGGPHVKVFSGATGAEIRSFFAYDSGFHGGVYVAAGKVNQDGFADIITGAGAGGGPHVRAFSGANLQEIGGFFAYDGYSGGVTVGAADVNGDGRADIITGTAGGGGPHVKAFAIDGQVLQSFFAYDSAFAGGVSVAGGRINSDLKAEIVTGAGPGGGSSVKVFDGANLSTIVSFSAYRNGLLPVLPPGGFATAGVDQSAPVVTLTDTPPDITNTNLTLHGKVTDNISSGLSLTARVDGSAPQNVVLDSGNLFRFETRLATDGSANGPHTIVFQARDSANNLSAPLTVTFTLDTTGAAINFDLDAASDTGTTGNHTTELDTVVLSGQGPANAQITLVETGDQVNSDANGAFNFTGVHLFTGANYFTVRATNSGGKIVEFVRTIILNTAPTVGAPAADLNLPINSGNSTINLPTIFSDQDVNSLVRFNTNRGAVTIELFDQQVGATVRNFLNYVANLSVSGSSYANTIFHRKTTTAADGIAVLQGGGFKFSSNPSSLTHLVTDPPIALQAIFTNVLGTIAMARTSDPNSATSEFYFNMGDNQVLDPGGASDPNGYAVFGVVRDGLNFLSDAFATPAQNRGGTFASIPLRNYPPPPAGSFPTDTTLDNYEYVSTSQVLRRPFSDAPDALTFAVTGNTNPGLVTATITGGKLVLSYAPNQEGVATITLTATDSNGATVENQFTVTVGNPDVSPPTITVISPADGLSSTVSPVIQGTVTDNVRVDRFQASVDGDIPQDVTFDPVTGNFSFNPLVSSEGAHTVTFTANDPAGNQATPLVFHYIIDTIAPSITITSPASGLSFATNPSVVGTVTDAVGVTQFQVSVDGGAAQNVTLDSSGGFTFATSLATDGSADGAHTLTFTASDAAGNASTPVNFQFTLDTTRPTISVTSPANGQAFLTNPLIKGVATDNNAVAQVTVSMDGGPAANVTLDPSGNFNFTPSLATNGSADGSHTATFLATDAAGNVSTAFVLTFRLDTIAPVVVITSPGDGQTFNTNPVVVGQATDAGVLAHVRVSVDNGPDQEVTFNATGNFSFTPSIATDGSANGIHTLRFTALDDAGNTSIVVTLTFNMQAP